MEKEPQTNVDDAQASTPAPDMPAPITTKRSFSGTMKSPVTLVAILLVAVLGAIGGTLLLTSDNANENQASVTPAAEVAAEPTVQQLAAAITLAEGPVQYSNDGGKTWADSTGGETVSELDYVRTLAGGRAVVLLDDGSAVRLDSDTTMYLSVSTTEEVEVMLTEGQVYSRVAESDSRVFSVSTANESFTAKGTAYKTTADGEKDSLEVYQSAVEVKSEGLVVEEGNKYDTDQKSKESLDIESLKDDDFVQWNKGKDLEADTNKDKLGVLGEKEEPKEEPVATTPSTPSTPSNPSASINLSGSATESGINFNWSLTNTSSSDGFKLVRSKSDSTPSYGKDTAVYIGNGSSRNYNLNLKDGVSYYFRVCIYRSGGACDTYSNSVRVTAPFDPPATVETGAVNLAIAGQNISWTFGGTAPHGFKVTLSENENPTYPQNSIQYVGAGQTTATLPAKTPGTYYVRVCKYTASDVGGGCVDYSQQVQYVVAE